LVPQVQAVLLLLGGRELNPGPGGAAASSAPYSKVVTAGCMISFNYLWKRKLVGTDGSYVCICFYSEAKFPTPGGITDEV
jgi:hypothetical protein